MPSCFEPGSRRRRVSCRRAAHLDSRWLQFKFKHANVTAHGELGFLVPYGPARHEWPEADLQYVQTSMLPCKTNFYLPFRAHGQHSMASAAKELAKQFSTDMQPETVLFLRKARAQRPTAAGPTAARLR